MISTLYISVQWTYESQWYDFESNIHIKSKLKVKITLRILAYCIQNMFL